MKFDINTHKFLVRFLTNQQIDSGKKKLKKRVFFDSRHFNKCSIAFPVIEAYLDIKKIANKLNPNAKFKAFAQLNCEFVLKQGQQLELCPVVITINEEDVDFASHGHILYVEFELTEGAHIPPKFEMILENLKRGAEFLLDEDPDSDEFKFETYVVNPHDVKGRKLIKKEDLPTIVI